MRKQWIPGSSFRPHKEPGYEAKWVVERLGFYVVNTTVSVLHRQSDLSSGMTFLLVTYIQGRFCELMIGWARKNM